MAKEERLQLRMEEELKLWFKRHATEKGKSMSQLVTDFVQRLRARNERSKG